MGQESVDTLRIFEELSPTLGEEAARKLASLLGSMYVELREVVRREDFTDLNHLVLRFLKTFTFPNAGCRSCATETRPGVG